MTVRDLEDKLSEFDPDLEVVLQIYDYDNEREGYPQSLDGIEIIGNDRKVFLKL